MATRPHEPLLELAEKISAIAGELAHDANNLVLVLSLANEQLEESGAAPVVPGADLERVAGYAENLCTLAADIDAVLERLRPTAD